MNRIAQLLDLVGPAAESTEVLAGKAHRRALGLLGFLGALPLAAIWGVAAGSRPGHFALDNALDVPLLVVVAALAALPVGLFAFRLATTRTHGSDLVLAHSAALFAGATALALLSPIVGIFQHSSAWGGPLVAALSAAVGGAVALLALFRALARLLPDVNVRKSLALPIFVLLSVEAAAFTQVASITSPIFAEPASFHAQELR